MMASDGSSGVDAPPTASSVTLASVRSATASRDRLTLALDHVAETAARFRDDATWRALRSLGPLLIDRPSAVERLNPPTAVIADWRVDARRMRAQHIVQADALAELEHAWWKAGVAVLAFKGFDIATRFYPDPSRRPMDDIDILVRPADAAALAEVLIERGYSRVDREPGRFGLVDDDVQAAWTFRRSFGPGSVEIDCHWRAIADRRVATLLPGISALDLWEDAVAVEPEGTLRPSASRAAQFCAISQIVGHPWSHPLGYLDLFLLADRGNWETISTPKMPSNLEQPLALAERFTCALYGGPSPGSNSNPSWAIRALTGDDWLGRREWRRGMLARDALLVLLGGPNRFAALVREEVARTIFSPRAHAG